MQLTQFTDNALRVLMYLGFRNEDQVTISEISSAYDISRSYLMKVVSHLAAKGFVHTSRGKGGGIRLSRHPSLINLGEVIRECEPDFHVVECLGPVQSSCPLLPNACCARSCARRYMGSSASWTSTASKIWWRAPVLVMSSCAVPTESNVAPLTVDALPAELGILGNVA
ncbi:RrF2 family transcriptional regulator [Halomonas sp. BC04]|uniref:RrF2 family transcriptional regulator n=1 Tax=Halomonas sp. BC04 TaxID=1403540 RepID=UPI0003ED7CC7|nr:hypothetical protein Q427_29560 [Halomonas sp. BC04]